MSDGLNRLYVDMLRTVSKGGDSCDRAYFRQRATKGVVNVEDRCL